MRARVAAPRVVKEGRSDFRFAGILPADFLIAPSGRINTLKYGANAYDQWSVDELLTLAKGTAGQAP